MQNIRVCNIGGKGGFDKTFLEVSGKGRLYWALICQYNVMDKNNMKIELDGNVIANLSIAAQTVKTKRMLGIYNNKHIPTTVQGKTYVYTYIPMRYGTSGGFAYSFKYDSNESADYSNLSPDEQEVTPNNTEGVMNSNIILIDEYVPFNTKIKISGSGGESEYGCFIGYTLDE